MDMSHPKKDNKGNGIVEQNPLSERFQAPSEDCFKQ